VWDRPEWKDTQTEMNELNEIQFTLNEEEKTRASMIPVTQLTFGRSLLQAWIEKYSQPLPTLTSLSSSSTTYNSNDNNNNNNNKNVCSLTIGQIGNKTVDLLTRTTTTSTTTTTITINQTALCSLSLPLLSCVGLREHFIARHLSHTHSDSILQTLSSHVTEFDLSANLLSTWDDIVSCVQYMTKLHTLNLSENRFSPFTEPLVTCEAFHCLRVLVLNDCALDWKHHILTLCRVCSSLEELHLAKNQLSSLRPLSDFTKLTGLRLLNLSSNRFTQWTELRPVS
jgi:hypothetical protein